MLFDQLSELFKHFKLQRSTDIGALELKVPFYIIPI